MLKLWNCYQFVKLGPKYPWVFDPYTLACFVNRVTPRIWLILFKVPVNWLYWFSFAICPGGAADSAGSDDETFADNASVISNASEQSFAREEGGAGGFGAIPENDDGGEGGDETADDVFEDKLRDAIEMATQKSAAGRVGALNAICKCQG